MLKTLAVSNYRSLRDITIPLGDLNVISGPNGSGKSNLYRSLRLLADTATGGVIRSIAREGGLPSTFWAGPPTVSAGMAAGDVPIQGTHRKNGPARLRLGFTSEDFGYSISLGLPVPDAGAGHTEPTAFSLDPEIKHECIWAGDAFRPAASLVERKGPLIKVRTGRRWEVVTQHQPTFDSLLSFVADPEQAPEVLRLRESIRAWRFYDHFRTDADAAARLSQLGTKTPVLDDDGHDLAAALQTVREIGDRAALENAIDDAFPGAALQINVQDDNRFSIGFRQEGLLRPLSGSELSDGTLRYLLWIAALLTPRPPPLVVLNEPETSLHPDLLPALGRLIVRASDRSQVWVVTHSSRLIAALEAHEVCNAIQLGKALGQTEVIDQGLLDRPAWHWPE
jgi:predicted ATPase